MIDLTIPHPIHVHLINYQVVARYTLKTTQDNVNPNIICTLYALDYYKINKT
jgi:hypothetical protein